MGQPVVALGSPLGLTSTVTTGIVSALNRYVRVPGENGQAAHLVGAIQTDASVNPGNSGGALVDCRAHLVGINTAGAALSNTPTIGLGFAIPIDLAEGIASELITAGKVTRPSLGIQVQTISKELARATGGSAGLFVQCVTAGGPADKAGVRPGDVIVEIVSFPAAAAVFAALFLGSTLWFWRRGSVRAVVALMLFAFEGAVAPTLRAMTVTKAADFTLAIVGVACSLAVLIATRRGKRASGRRLAEAA